MDFGFSNYLVLKTTCSNYFSSYIINIFLKYVSTHNVQICSILKCFQSKHTKHVVLLFVSSCPGERLKCQGICFILLRQYITFLCAYVSEEWDGLATVRTLVDYQQSFAPLASDVPEGFHSSCRADKKVQAAVRDVGNDWTGILRLDIRYSKAHTCSC